MPTESVLLVDDIPDHISTYRVALRNRGFRVHVARTGQEALKTVAAALPHCAVIDLRLPDMSGWELCRRIRSGDAKNIRVIVLTPEVSRICATESAKAGCHAWLMHPAAADALVETVEQVLAMQTDAPASREDALIGLMECAGCGSEDVRATLRIGAAQYYCCQACAFCRRVDTRRRER